MGSGAQPDFQVEIEARAEDVLAQQAPLAALPDRVLDPLDGHRIFGPHVEEAAMGADGETADQHTFDHVERITFQHAAVHERAGVALVGVADEVADRVGRLRAHLPFLPGRISASASAAQLRAADFVDHPFRVVLLQHRGQRLEAAVVEILFDAVGIDHTVVTQGHAALAVEKAHVAVKLQELAPHGLARHLQAFHRPAGDQVLADDLVQIGLVGHSIQHFVRPHQQVRELAGLGRATGTETTRVGHANLLGTEPSGAEFFGQNFAERLWALPSAADTAANENIVAGQLLDRAIEHPLQHGLALLNVLGEDGMDRLAVDPFVFDGHLAGGDDADDRLAAATAGAAGLMQQDIAAARGGDMFTELLQHVVAAGGVFAGGRADLDANSPVRSPLAEHVGGFLDQGFELFGDLVCHYLPLPDRLHIMRKMGENRNPSLLPSQLATHH